MADHVREIDDIRDSFGVSTLIGGVGIGVLGEGGVGSQISGAVEGVGRRDGVGVAIAGNAQHDLVRGETCGNPSLDGLDRRASLNSRARVVQRSVRTDTRGGSPLTLRNESSDVFPV